MKRLLQSLRRQEGFTLVELMVVVAIIGLLSAVAIPNFKKYQARSKITEAKLQLSALYTAQQSFFADHNMYARCLRYMGFDPYGERKNRYYGVGISAGVQTLNANAYSAATNNGLQTGDCAATNAAVAAADATTMDVSWFAAEKGVGGAIISGLASATANNAGVAQATCDNATIGGGAGTGSCLGTQADTSTMVFQASAVGIISGDYQTGSNASGLNINHNKIIKSVVNGY